MKIMLAAAAASFAVLLGSAAAEAAPLTGGSGAGYGRHIATHAREDGGFSGQMNPGNHRGFAGFDEHH